MKKMLAVIVLFLISGCVAEKAAAPQPQWFDAYADETLSVRAMYTADSFGSGEICFELTNLSQSAMTFSSVLGLRAERDGQPVEITAASGLDRQLAPGETAFCTVTLACQGSQGCVLNVAADYASGKWITISESPLSPEE